MLSADNRASIPSFYDRIQQSRIASTDDKTIAELKEYWQALEQLRSTRGDESHLQTSEAILCKASIVTYHGQCHPFLLCTIQLTWVASRLLSSSPSTRLAKTRTRRPLQTASPTGSHPTQTSKLAEVRQGYGGFATARGFSKYLDHLWTKCHTKPTPYTTQADTGSESCRVMRRGHQGTRLGSHFSSSMMRTTGTLPMRPMWRRTKL